MDINLRYGLVNVKKLNWENRGKRIDLICLQDRKLKSHIYFYFLG